MSKEINFDALTGEIWDEGFQKNQKTFKKAEDVAEKIYKKIRGKACFLVPCGNSVIEARTRDNVLQIKNRATYMQSLYYKLQQQACFLFAVINLIKLWK